MGHFSFSRFHDYIQFNFSLWKGEGYVCICALPPYFFPQLSRTWCLLLLEKEGSFFCSCVRVPKPVAAFPTALSRWTREGVLLGCPVVQHFPPCWTWRPTRVTGPNPLQSRLFSILSRLCLTFAGNDVSTWPTLEMRLTLWFGPKIKRSRAPSSYGFSLVQHLHL